MDDLSKVIAALENVAESIPTNMSISEFAIQLLEELEKQRDLGYKASSSQE